MNKKLLTISTLMLAATVASASLATLALAEDNNTNANVGVNLTAPGLIMHTQSNGDGNNMMGGEHRGAIVGKAAGHMMSGIYGTVTAVSGNTVTVQSKTFTKGSTTSTMTTYTVDASVATIVKNKAASVVSAIAVGDTIMVQGTLTGTSIVAKTIIDGIVIKNQPEIDKNSTTLPIGNGQPIVVGTVTAINGSTVTITNKSNVSYTINVAGATVTKNGDTSTVSNVTVGDTVLAQGTINGTSVTAVSLTDSATASTNVNKHKGFFGMIGAFFARFF